jgi:hypothetical protein
MVVIEFLELLDNGLLGLLMVEHGLLQLFILSPQLVLDTVQFALQLAIGMAQELHLQ